MPTHEEIQEITSIIRKSFQKLIRCDNLLFEITAENSIPIPGNHPILDRTLHETTINHRFALYLENFIQRTLLNRYYVDLEYNRYYLNPKALQTSNGEVIARPDIVIHSRTNRNIHPQHYLAIEAKKENILPHDIEKVKGFLSDNNYNYLFGFTISYSNHIGKLYYRIGEEIREEVIIQGLI